jgi:hypothetical protein
MDTFINSDEFATDHMVNGVKMSIIIDNDLIKERQAKLKDPEGIYIGDILFHVAKSVFGDKPVPGQIINLDGDPYRVADAQEDEGLYTITLAANES